MTKSSGEKNTKKETIKKTAAKKVATTGEKKITAKKVATAEKKKTATKKVATAEKKKTATKKVATAEKKKTATKKTKLKVEEQELLLDCIVNAMQEKKGENVIILDMTNIIEASFEKFIICDARSAPHIKSIAESVEELVEKNLKIKALHTEGYANGEWILLDYGSIVAHVFLDYVREHYKLENLWQDAIIKLCRDEY